MVDNVAITAGAGTTVATDDIAGVHYQRVKVAIGADGTAVDLSAGTGVDGTGVPRVTLATNVGLPAGTAAIGKVKVTNDAGTVVDPVAAGSAAMAASVPVTIATDDTQFAAMLKAEDAAHSSGDKGIMALAVRTDTLASSSGTTGDYTAITTDSVGRVYVAPGATVVQAASATIARPADTTAYTSGDLIANSTTAVSVNALQFTTLARVSGGSGVIVGATIQKSTNVTTSVAMRVHLFNTIPTFATAGDNSAMTTVVVASAKGYLGYIDVTTFVGFSDVAWGTGAPDNSRGGIPFVATAQIIYGIVEARGAFTPGNAEVYTISLAAYQD